MKVVYYIKGLFTLKPVVIDGILCVIAAAMGYWESSLGKDEAFKYWNSYALYYVKELLGGFDAGIIALIFFRSKSYSDHLEKQKIAQAASVGDTKTTVTEIKTNETKIDTTPPTGSVAP